MAKLILRLLHINFYIFAGLVLISAAIAFIASGSVAMVAAKFCLVFAAIMLLGSIFGITLKLMMR